MMNNIVEIKSKKSKALINLSRGANCISFVCDELGADVLRTPDYENLDNPFLYGLPIIFPANRISGGKYEFGGRIYSFPINEPATGCHLHGVLHETEFIIEEQKENCVKCRLCVNACDGFPHDFDVVITYEITDYSLKHTTQIINKSALEMPCFLGFHTTFNLPFVKGSKAESCRVYAELGDEIERNMTNYLPTGVVLPSDEITKSFSDGSFKPCVNTLSRHYKAGRDGAIELYDIDKQVKITYKNDEKYNFRLFYNGGAKEFICLEPMNCMANCANSPFDREYAGFSVIKPNETEIFYSEIIISRMN